jgi:hypothetical protein
MRGASKTGFPPSLRLVWTRMPAGEKRLSSPLLFVLRCYPSIGQLSLLLLPVSTNGVYLSTEYTPIPLSRLTSARRDIMPFAPECEPLIHVVIYHSLGSKENLGLVGRMLGRRSRNRTQRDLRYRAPTSSSLSSCLSSSACIVCISADLSGAVLFPPPLCVSVTPKLNN